MNRAKSILIFLSLLYISSGMKENSLYGQETPFVRGAKFSDDYMIKSVSINMGGGIVESYDKKAVFSIGQNSVGVVANNQYLAKIGFLTFLPLESITIIAPDGGEVFVPGDTILISWNSMGNIDSVKLEYSLNSGIDWILIDSTENSGSYSWIVPDTTSQQCRIKISDLKDGYPYDISDSDFAIMACLSVCLPDTYVIPDSQLVIPLMVIDTVTGQEIYSLNTTINFDPAVVEVESVFNEGTLTQACGPPIYSISEGEVNIAVACLYPLSGAGPLLYLVIRSIGQVSEQSCLHFADFMFNEGTPVACAEDGSVQIRYHGDANGDGYVSIADLTFISNYLFANGTAPSPLLIADCNGDCVVDIADLVYLANYLFMGGPPPIQCGSKLNIYKK